MSDEEIMRALVGQVAFAANGGSELEVTTVITRPMWKAFLRATDIGDDVEPTEWLGPFCTARVYGSKTIVVEREEMASVSFIE